jgi:SNF family Na+-dependent transporter
MIVIVVYVIIIYYVCILDWILFLNVLIPSEKVARRDSSKQNLQGYLDLRWLFEVCSNE